MRVTRHLRLALLALTPAAIVFGQNPPRIVVPQLEPPQQPQAQPQPQQPQTPPAPNPAAPATQPAQPAPRPRLAGTQPFQLGAVSLKTMIDIIAQELKLNYILDPRVNGQVTIYTYGEVKPVDLMQLLETVLRVNNATIVKVGEFYRVIPISAISQMPVSPVTNADPKALPDDERMVLNMIFLKYASAGEMDKLLAPFYGEGASHSVYEPANLLILQDNARSMRRTMELMAMFDSESFASQRVRVFEIENSRPSELTKELDAVFKAYTLADKSSGVKFIPVDRINLVIAVCPNPRVFDDVQKWIDKLDVAVKTAAGAVNNYVYRLKYARAETLAMAIMALYSGNPFALASLAAMSGGGGGFGGGYGGFGGGYGGFGGGYGGFGGGYGGFGGGGYGGFGGGYGGFGGGGYGGFNGAPGYNGQPNVLMGYGAAQQYGMGAVQQGTINIPQGANANPAPVGSGDQTGAYLGLSALGVPPGTRIPHVIPNPFDNTLLVQANPQEWEQISSLLRQLDVAPRQVLIDAKIYELDLSGAFASGVQAFLEKRGTGTMTDRALNVASNAGGVLSVGALVLRSHELMLAVSAAETQKKSRIISSPSIIATDSVPAVMNVGQDVPVLTSSGVAVTGSSFNSISNRSTGTTLSILARVSSSGVVTMVIDQDVSQPIDVSQSGSAGSTINSPSFSSRRFSTQLTVNDGDTIAIGGFIQESTGSSSVGIPILQRIPILGAAFGSKAYSKSRTELVVFLTPRVIYDAAQLQDAAEEIKGNLKRIQKMIKDDR